MITEQRKLYESFVDKWDSIVSAISLSTYEREDFDDEEINLHLENISEAVDSIGSEAFTLKSFEEAEVHITLLENKIDELYDTKAITKELWSLINISIYNFINFLSYLRVTTKKS